MAGRNQRTLTNLMHNLDSVNPETKFLPTQKSMKQSSANAVSKLYQLTKQYQQGGDY